MAIKHELSIQLIISPCYSLSLSLSSLQKEQADVQFNCKLFQKLFKNVFKVCLTLDLK
jgi:hypothetical protein